MKKMRIENPLGLFGYTLKGENAGQVDQAVIEFQEALDYINHLPYNMTYTTKQIQNRKNEIEQKYNVKIGKI
ncbi:MAG: hypothetical protein MJA31_18005, partial [Clostridia bacterium]|nr:hypothetical protein [Clostridia bacterium]